MSKLQTRTSKPEGEQRPISKKPGKSRLPDMSGLWRRFPSVAADSGRFLEEDR